MSAGPVNRKGRKFDQVLAGAQEIFLRDGFEGASVDEIARTAGVSKATLYKYFPDKRLLFIEVASDQCCRLADEALVSMDLTRPPKEVLTEAGQRFVNYLYSDMSMRVCRICMAESERFPEIGKRFYESGPMLMRKALTLYLEVAQSRGELVIDDMALAADQFGELCKADLWLKLAFGIQREVTKSQTDRVVAGAVDTFLARYGVI